jgi:excinuclease UvrABC nuclease subunit
MEDSTDLYRHWDKDHVLLYVGISLSAMHRLRQHKETSKWFSEIVSVTIERFETRTEAMAAERKAIKSENPKYNIQHRRGAGATYADEVVEDSYDALSGTTRKS